MGNEIPFNKIARYYDLLYKDKNYDEEVNYIDNILKRYLKSEKKILELGCGTGKHALLLKKKGYEVQGVDRSQEMINIAHNKGFINSFVSDIDSFQLSSKFNAIIALFHVVSYLNENDKIDKVLSNTKNHLKKNGLFLFDVWFTPGVIRQKPETRVKKISDHEIEITRIAKPFENHEKNLVKVNYDYFVKNINDEKIIHDTEIHLMRHFSLPELERIAENNGFRLISYEPWMDKNQISDKTWAITVIFEAK